MTWSNEMSYKKMFKSYKKISSHIIFLQPDYMSYKKKSNHKNRLSHIKIVLP